LGAQALDACADTDAGHRTEVEAVPAEHVRRPIPSVSGGEAKKGKMSEIKVSSVEGYLHALGTACLEAAREPRVRGLLFRVLLLAPRTLCELRQAELERRLAA
jgi:hypothetical protein